MRARRSPLLGRRKRSMRIAPIYTAQRCGVYFRGSPYSNKDLNIFIQYLMPKGARKSCKLILKEKWLVLDIMNTNGRLRSIDNRGLHCLQEYHKYLPDFSRRSLALRRAKGITFQLHQILRLPQNEKDCQETC